MNPQSPSLEFIALFNELDKYLEDVINECDQHMNFAHKLKLVSQGQYTISHVVTQYFYELNYIGELRNQLVHGISFGDQAYIVPTDYAIQQLTHLSHLIMRPVSCIEIYAKPVISAQVTDRVLDTVHMMKDHCIDFVPVFHKGIYKGTLTEWVMIDTIAQHCASLADCTLEVITYQEGTNIQRYGSQHTILDVESYLLRYPHSVVYITSDGQVSDQLLGIVTEHDLVLHADLGLQQIS